MANTESLNHAVIEALNARDVAALAVQFGDQLLLPQPACFALSDQQLRLLEALLAASEALRLFDQQRLHPRAARSIRLYLQQVDVVCQVLLVDESVHLPAAGCG